MGFVHTLATLERHPESVPVNALVPVKGTVLGDMLADTPLAKIDDIEFVRTVAVARIAMPLSMVRLSAGRESMSDATQALCFLAGANSIFTGDRLLTAPNAGDDSDAALFARLGLKAMAGEEPMRAQLGPAGCGPWLPNRRWPCANCLASLWRSARRAIAIACCALSHRERPEWFSVTGAN